jgi:hypothetical protein
MRLAIRTRRGEFRAFVIVAEDTLATFENKEDARRNIRKRRAQAWETQPPDMRIAHEKVRTIQNAEQISISTASNSTSCHKLTYRTKKELARRNKE